MPRISLICALLAGFAALAGNGAVHAEAHGPRGPRFERGPHGHHGPEYRGRGYGHAPARHLSPEVRYRDPRYAPSPRYAPHPRHAPIARAPRFAVQPELFHAYLPRQTELPMYNEPPARFPQR